MERTPRIMTPADIIAQNTRDMAPNQPNANSNGFQKLIEGRNEFDPGQMGEHGFTSGQFSASQPDGGRHSQQK